MPAIYNDHNVYIIGAGFAAARGLPLISNFMVALRDAHEWLIERKRAAEAESVQRVLQFRLDSTPAAYRVQIDLENIEELFSLAAAMDASLTKDIRIAVAATLDYCAAIEPTPTTTLHVETGKFDLPRCFKPKSVGVPGRTVEFETSTYDFLVAGLLGLLDLPTRQATNAFITFNYDLLADDALVSLGVPFSYGFGPEAIIEHESIHGTSLSNKADLKLLKLHGSTNWAFPERQGQQLEIFRTYEEVRASGYAPALVPPTWRKSFDGPLVHVWQEALTQISMATRIVIIGFSVPTTDLHFKYLLAAGLRANISLRQIVFVNPDREGIERRAKDLFGDLERRPSVKILATPARTFIGEGRLAQNASSVGRTLHGAIRNVFQSY